MNIPFRPLIKVHELMYQIGYEPGYAYDDLVFSNDAVFLLQFGVEEHYALKLFVNKDCEKVEMQRIINKIMHEHNKELVVNYAGMFSLQYKKGSGKIEILFKL